jgi:hypothetical protein
MLLSRILRDSQRANPCADTEGAKITVGESIEVIRPFPLTHGYGEKDEKQAS